MLCDDLECWDGGGELEMEGIYIYIYGADSKSQLIGKAPDDGKD